MKNRTVLWVLFSITLTMLIIVTTGLIYFYPGRSVIRPLLATLDSDKVTIRIIPQVPAASPRAPSTGSVIIDGKRANLPESAPDQEEPEELENEVLMDLDVPKVDETADTIEKTIDTEVTEIGKEAAVDSKEIPEVETEIVAELITEDPIGMEDPIGKPFFVPDSAVEELEIPDSAAARSLESDTPVVNKGVSEPDPLPVEIPEVEPEPVPVEPEIVERVPEPEPEPVELAVVEPEPEPVPVEREIVEPEIVEPVPEPEPEPVELAVVEPEPEPVPAEPEIVVPEMVEPVPEPEPEPVELAVVEPEPEPVPVEREIVEPEIVEPVPEPEPEPVELAVVEPEPEPVPAEPEIVEPEMVEPEIVEPEPEELYFVLPTIEPRYWTVAGIFPTVNEAELRLDRLNKSGLSGTIAVLSDQEFQLRLGPYGTVEQAIAITDIVNSLAGFKNTAAVKITIPR